MSKCDSPVCLWVFVVVPWLSSLASECVFAFLVGHGCTEGLILGLDGAASPGNVKEASKAGSCWQTPNGL